MALTIEPNCEHHLEGIHLSEKIHEEFITSSDSFNTVDLGRYFAILPSTRQFSVESYCTPMADNPSCQAMPTTAAVTH